jgi:hypothetical protein
MRLVTISSYISVIVILSGCAHDPSPKNLKIYSGPSKIVNLREQICVQMKEAWEREVDVCVLPGNYKLEQFNDAGYFYRNAVPSVTERGTGANYQNSKYNLRMGGVWMPVNVVESPKIFWDSGQITGTIASLDEANKPQVSKQNNSSNIANELIAQQVSQNTSPAAAGVGGAIAGGIISAFTSGGPFPLLYSAPLDPKDSEKLRYAFGKQ